jgi:hypothetical protein
MVYDTIFECLFDAKYDVDKQDIDRFVGVMKSRNLPKDFIFETQEGIFKINKKRREFKIIKRKYIDGDYEYNMKVDYAIMALYKIACWSGYNAFLEIKYSN